MTAVEQKLLGQQKLAGLPHVLPTYSIMSKLCQKDLEQIFAGDCMKDIAECFMVLATL